MLINLQCKYRIDYRLSASFGDINIGYRYMPKTHIGTCQKPISVHLYTLIDLPVHYEQIELCPVFVACFSPKL